MQTPEFKEKRKDTQWQPGQSGNPAGKPKGAKHISTWIQELLNDEEFTGKVLDGDDLKEYKGAPAKAIVRAHAQLALQGNVKAADLLFKYGYGTKTTLANDPENPLTPAIADATVAAEFAEYMKQKTSEQ